MNVTDAEVREALLVYGRVLREGTVWNKKLHAMRAALESFLAARTTARGEPTPEAIEAGQRAYRERLRATRERMIVPSHVEEDLAVRDAIRAAFAARNAGQGVTE